MGGEHESYTLLVKRRSQVLIKGCSTPVACDPGRPVVHLLDLQLLLAGFHEVLESAELLQLSGDGHSVRDHLEQGWVALGQRQQRRQLPIEEGHHNKRLTSKR